MTYLPFYTLRIRGRSYNPDPNANSIHKYKPKLNPYPARVSLLGHPTTLTALKAESYAVASPASPASPTGQRKARRANPADMLLDVASGANCQALIHIPITSQTRKSNSHSLPIVPFHAALHPYLYI